MGGSTLHPVSSGVTGGGHGAECPQRLLTRKFLLTYRENRSKGKKKGKEVKIEKKRRKIVKGKVKNLKWKVEKLQNEERTFLGEDPFFPFFFFFFFCFPLFKTTKICFGSTKMEIFYWEKAFHTGEKNQEK